MTKVTASTFSNRKTRNLIILSLNQNQNLKGFFEKEQNTQQQKPTYACILQKRSKKTLNKISAKQSFKEHYFLKTDFIRKTQNDR